MEEQQQQAEFAGWAVLEIMGHQRYAGYVTTQAFGQAVLFRVDVPELPEREETLQHSRWMDDRLCPPETVVKADALPGYTKFFGAGSIYCLTPCDETAARKVVESLVVRSIQIVKLGPEQKQVEARAPDPSLVAVPLEPDDGEIPF